MQLDLAQIPDAELAGTRMLVGSRETLVWPAEQPLQEIADPRILGTRFQDGELIAANSVSSIMEQAARQPANFHGWGGKKVRDAATWSLPALQLLTQRALLLFCRARGVSSAHVVDRWANALESGDYSTPHCHYDAESAVVYSLDPGDEQADIPTSGKLEIIDPRIEFCCSHRPGYPSRGILPAMAPGTMLLFPASFLHYVKPYHGVRPRLTIAWNLNPGASPEQVTNMEAQQLGSFGEVQ